MHGQADDQAEIIRLGLNEVRANLWIRDAIPDARHIEREAFVEVNRQRADRVVGGVACFTTGVLTAILRAPFDAAGNIASMIWTREWLPTASSLVVPNTGE